MKKTVERPETTDNEPCTSWIEIDGERIEYPNVITLGNLTMIEDGNREWYVFEDTETAGEAAREYWQDLADNDPGEFACIVGNETLISWALGRSAGPGSTAVHSLDEWLDPVARYTGRTFCRPRFM